MEFILNQSSVLLDHYAIAPTMDFDDNLTDFDDNMTDLPKFIPKRTPTPLAFTVIIVMEVVMGMVTNGTLFYLVGTVRELRTPPNILLANLALGDFLFIVITAPPVIAPSYMRTTFHYCRLNHFFYHASFGVSSMSLTAVSIERYFAIVKPFLVRRLSIMRATVVLCLIIWVITCSISCFVFFDAVLSPAMVSTCTFKYEKLSYKIFYTIQLVFFYVVPVFSMTFFYALCARKLLSEKTILHRRRSANADDKARLRVSINLFIITLVFTICWLPQYVYLSWLIFDFNLVVFSRPSWYILGRLRIVLYYLASCINPIILYSMSSSFRQHLARKFGLYRATRSFRNFSETSGRTRSSVIIRTPSMRSIPQLALPVNENSNNVDQHLVRTASESV
ncbi:neuropeptide CCHamide-1 receptor-like [Diadema antillarum]|uniref:neuropeptide CCHamide-1 receptor-like n=1 Tax=Diadema antillarum TaxID=105358 RepID=UPI003A887B90